MRTGRGRKRKHIKIMYNLLDLINIKSFREKEKKKIRATGKNCMCKKCTDILRTYEK